MLVFRVILRKETDFSGTRYLGGDGLMLKGDDF
jgi:hypothetical protein